MIDSGGTPAPLSSEKVVGFDLKGIGESMAEGFVRVAQTGAAVETIFTIPYAHRIRRIEVKHVDAALADNTDALTWYISRYFPDAGVPFAILSYTSSTVTDKQIVMEDSFAYPDGQQYVLSTNTTTAHYVYFRIIVEIL